MKCDWRKTCFSRFFILPLPEGVTQHERGRGGGMERGEMEGGVVGAGEKGKEMGSPKKEHARKKG